MCVGGAAEWTQHLQGAPGGESGSVQSPPQRWAWGSSLSRRWGVSESGGVTATHERLF